MIAVAKMNLIKTSSLFLCLLLGSIGQALAFPALEPSVGLRIGASAFTDLSDSGPTLEIGSYPVVGATTGVRLGHLSLELSADWIKTGFKKDFISVFAIPPIIVIGQLIILESDLTMIPILLTGRFHFLDKGSTVDPYIGFGGGYYINYVNSSQLFDVEIDNNFGYHASLGADIKISPALAFTMDARYVFAKTDLTFKTDRSFPSETATLNLDGFVITAGLRYFFPN